MPTDTDTDLLLAPEDVARRCRLSRRAVYRAIARGELKASRLCNRLRIRPAELERWIAERETKARPTRPQPQGKPRAPVAPGGLRAMLDS